MSNFSGKKQPAATPGTPFRVFDQEKNGSGFFAASAYKRASISHHDKSISETSSQVSPLGRPRLTRSQRQTFSSQQNSEAVVPTISTLQATQNASKSPSFIQAVSASSLATSSSQTLHKVSPPKSLLDPPRPAREGQEWVWFPDGYWAERPVIHLPVVERKKNRFALLRPIDNSRSLSSDKGSTERPRLSSIITKSSSALDVPDSVQAKHEAHEGMLNRLKHGLQGGWRSASSHPFHSPDKEGLAGRLMGVSCQLIMQSHRLTSFHAFSTGHDKNPALAVKTKTSVTLEGTANALRQLQKESAFKQALTSQSSDGLSKQNGKRYGIAPWHHGGSIGSLLSISSSTRAVLRGATPAASPNTDQYYEANGERHMKGLNFVHVLPELIFAIVDITRPEEATFLPSEARRVNTPPLPKSTPGTGKQRGFFFDMNAPLPSGSGDPINDTFTTQISTTTTTLQESPDSFFAIPVLHHKNLDSDPTADLPTPIYPRGRGAMSRDEQGGRSPGTSSRDWWDHEVATSQREKSVAFVLDLPEHLPTSPLCPMHPKHRSGGTGVCAYHGRGKSAKDEQVGFEGH